MRNRSIGLGVGMLCAVATGWSVGAQAPAAAPRGTITLTDGPNDNKGCHLKGAKKMTINVDASIPEQKDIEWKVVNDCRTTHRVAVGNFADKDEATGEKDAIDLVDCNPWAVTVAPGASGLIKCTIKPGCGSQDPNAVEDFAFDVCVDGFTLLDPEVRVKGKVTLEGGAPGCAATDRALAEARCRYESER
jgi:hypothetical protein